MKNPIPDNRFRSNSNSYSSHNKTRIRVAGLIIHGENILLAEHEKGGRRYWLLPGGGMEFAETVEEAADVLQEFYPARDPSQDGAHKEEACHGQEIQA